MPWIDRIESSPNVKPFDQLTEVLQRFDHALALDEQGLSMLNQQLARSLHSAQLRFVPQDKALLADGLTFEQRVAERGEIATRLGSLHDFYSALMWLRFPRVKLAVNRIHLRGIAEHGIKVRSRHQQAITHLDEAGAWLVSSDPNLLTLADAHQWFALFYQNDRCWSEPITESSHPRIEARIFGHAIFELMHQPHQLLAAKVIVVRTQPAYFLLSSQRKDELLDQLIARALENDQAGVDPKWLPTLPLSGIPGWQAQQDPSFYQTAPCFRAKPAGRDYAQALDLAC